MNTETEPDLMTASVRTARQRVLDHAVYSAVNCRSAVRVFMRYHVFAVWDFMSLLKRLQRSLTCTSVPWTPVLRPDLCRFVNEIVLGEECDEDGQGGYASHFELYRSAMREVGAETRPVDALVSGLQSGLSLDSAIRDAGMPPAAADFVRFNLHLSESAPVHSVAAAFFFGREDLIPEMFSRLIPVLQGGGEQFDRLVYYLNRHVELDGDHHGPLARQLLEHVCGTNAAAWRDASESATRSLELRAALWDAVLREIRETVGRHDTVGSRDAVA
jgi:hypothetical protein